MGSTEIPDRVNIGPSAGDDAASANGTGSWIGQKRHNKLATKQAGAGDLGQALPLLED